MKRPFGSPRPRYTKVVPELLSAPPPLPVQVAPKDWMLVAHDYVPGDDGCVQLILPQIPAEITFETPSIQPAVICGRRRSHAVHTR